MSPLQSAGEGLVRAVGAAGDVVAGEGDERDAKALIMGVATRRASPAS
jgi:hypothetical protein